MVRLYQQEWEKEHGVRWRFIADPERKLYYQFQMRSGPWSHILGWTAMKMYLYLVFAKGRQVKRPSSSDFKQLGGDVLIDPQGIIRQHYLSENPADRPTPEQLLAQLHATDAESPSDR